MVIRLMVFTENMKLHPAIGRYFKRKLFVPIKQINDAIPYQFIFACAFVEGKEFDLNKKNKKREKEMERNGASIMHIRPIIWDTPVQTTLYKIYRPTYYDCLWCVSQLYTNLCLCIPLPTQSASSSSRFSKAMQSKAFMLYHNSSEYEFNNTSTLFYLIQNPPCLTRTMTDNHKQYYLRKCNLVFSFT